MSSGSKNLASSWKYTALSASDISMESRQVMSGCSEKMPLLQGMEAEGGKSNFRTSGDGSTSPSKQTSFVKIHHRKSGRQNADNSTKEKGFHDSDRAEEPGKNENVNVNNVTSISQSTEIAHAITTGTGNNTGQNGARPKTATEAVPVTSDKSEDGKNANEKLDIVRKISELSLNSDVNESGIGWQLVGPYGTLKARRCQRLYAKTGRADDLALFYINGKFYAMEAWCSHMGGPLFDGDIENYNGRCHVMCPWHSYMFDLETGGNEIGLKQNVHEMKYYSGHVYVRYHTELTTEHVRTEPKIIEKGTRKTSVLEAPFKLE